MSWQHAFRVLWIGLLFSSSTHVAIGAEISLRSGSEFDLITLKGKIFDQDVATFRSAADASGKAIVVLNSPGGSALAGLDMGMLIHQRNFVTAVPEDTLCASACALMWLAGKPRAIAPGGAVGFHAVYFERDGSVSAQGNALVGAYLNQLGFSPGVIAYVTHAMPERMGYLSEGAARRIGLDVVWMEQSDRPSPQPPPRTGVSHTPYDSVSAVTLFYRALGAADGNTAAALVVPEKRGIGPFNEIEMAKFFGNMREPLQLRSDPRPLGPNLVLAEYHYVYKNGKVCNGRAEVTTTYIFGNTFIQGIKANC